MKKKFYLTLDTETATLPFANQICKNENDKQKISIAKPLVYDIGWVITDRQGTVFKKANYLVQETFFVPNVFNTAYYKNKRPIYMDLLAKGEIEAMQWNEIVKELLSDLQTCDYAAAYNAAFDFKKAIPFTENYIYHLYNIDYNEWESKQRKNCNYILKSKRSNKKSNPEYLNPIFKLRGQEFPIVDLWDIACDRLINNQSYKDYCLKNNLWTNSITYFKTSAETTYQYIMRDSEFIEDHTALSDALIESQILAKALKKGKVIPTLNAFPFQKLGTTYDYVREKTKYKDNICNALKDYLENKGYDMDIMADLDFSVPPYYRNLINQYYSLIE